MITVNKIKEDEVKIFQMVGECPEPEIDTFIGTCENQLSCLDIRVQIKNAKVDGYYLVFENDISMITNRGELVDHPRNLYKKMDDLLIAVLGWI